MHPLLQKQQVLQDEASVLLRDILTPLLAPYGEVRVGGSYVYELLNHPDLDIDIITAGATKELYAELSAALIALPNTSKFKSGDRVNFPHAHSSSRPTGYWISPEIAFNQNV